MAKGTRVQERRVEDAIRSLLRIFEKEVETLSEFKESQAAALNEIKQLIVAMDLKYEQLVSKMSGSHQNQAETSQAASMATFSNGWQPEFTKVDFPSFQGDDPATWLYKCERFFEFYGIEETHKVGLASMHLDGKALHWFWWFEKTHCCKNWKEFSWAVTERFGPISDAVGELTKLVQTSTVMEYLERFEELSIRISGLPEDFFISCFISGLKEEIKIEVQMYRPMNITEAIRLARLQEVKIEAITRKTRLLYEESFHLSSNCGLPNKQGAPSLPIKKITTKELEEKTQKGLCFICDKKYTRDHVCKKKQLFFIKVDEEVDEDDEESIEENVMGLEAMATQSQMEEHKISLHALSGSVSSGTMKVKGRIKNMMITILISSGSTHNFLDPRVAKSAGCKVISTPPLTVTMVADGTKISSRAVCNDFQWTMQGTTFQAEMRLLPLGGCDVILGAEWLTTLGSVLWNFEELRMEFTVDKKNIVLRGSNSLEVQMDSEEKHAEVIEEQTSGSGSTAMHFANITTGR